MSGKTVMYVRTFLGPDGEKRETFRHIGAAFPVRDGDPGDVDLHLWEMPPFEVLNKPDKNGVIVTEQRIRIMVRTRRDRPAEPEVSNRRGGGFSGG